MSQIQKKLNANIFGENQAQVIPEPRSSDSTSGAWLVQAEVSELRAEVESLKSQTNDAILRTNSFIKSQLAMNEKLQKQDLILNERDQNMTQAFNEQMRSLASRMAEYNDQEMRLKKLTSEHLSILGKMETRLLKQEKALAERDAQINFLQSLLREMQHEIDKMQKSKK